MMTAPPSKAIRVIGGSEVSAGILVVQKLSAMSPGAIPSIPMDSAMSASSSESTRDNSMVADLGALVEHRPLTRSPQHGEAMVTVAHRTAPAEVEFFHGNRHLMRRRPDVRGEDLRCHAECVTVMRAWSPEGRAASACSYSLPAR
jgi:hypothetical protein